MRVQTLNGFTDRKILSRFSWKKFIEVELSMKAVENATFHVVHMRSERGRNYLWINTFCDKKTDRIAMRWHRINFHDNVNSTRRNFRYIMRICHQRGRGKSFILCAILDVNFLQKKLHPHRSFIASRLC